MKSKEITSSVVTEYLKTIIRNGVTAVLYVAFWPLICHAKKFYHEGHYLTSSGEARIKERKKFEASTIVSSRAQISEVCSEASFQPLLQLYLLLPQIMFFEYSKMFEGTVSDFFNDVPELQFWSILTSCLALAWSFSSYQATKMNGALDFTSNFAGRLVLLLSCICQISARLVLFVIFAYTWGAGHFWPMVVGCFLHMLLMALIHWVTRNDAHATDELFWKNGQVLYQCLINGISNLYVHTSIVPREIGDERRNKKEEEKEKDVHKCFKKEEMERDLKQILVDVIICAENLAIVLGAYYSTIGVETWFLVTVLAVHATGLALMVTFCFQNHIIVAACIPIVSVVFIQISKLPSGTFLPTSAHLECSDPNLPMPSQSHHSQKDGLVPPVPLSRYE